MTKKNTTINVENKEQYKKRSMWAEVWRNYRKNPSAMIGLFIVIALVVIAIFARIYYDFDTDIVQQNVQNKFMHPNGEHLFGTDHYGRDVFTRVLYGASYSLIVGIVSVAISCILGTTLGVIAAYYGGVIENLIMRFCDIFVGIPSILLGVAIMSAFGQSIAVLMWAIGLVYVPMFARIARAAVLPVRDQEYIEAARVIGVKDGAIMIKHILPNALSPIIVQTTMGVANAILTASNLSFLGLGIPVPAPEWGAMLSESRNYMRDHAYLTIFPGVAIMLTVLAFNLMGDGLRDALDPKLKK